MSSDILLCQTAKHAVLHSFLKFFYIGPQTNICKALEQADGILEKSNREQENWGRVHDPLNPKASDIVWDYMNRNLFSLGVDAWWLDSTEPSFQIDSSLALLDCSDCYLGKNSRYLNHYAMATSRNIYKHQRGETDEKRVYILTRSGYADSRHTVLRHGPEISVHRGRCSAGRFLHC